METRHTGWHPPHCPNPNCNHHNAKSPDWPYRKHGFFTRRLKPHRIQRFTCKTCGRAFSSQTFSVTYWLKRPDILPKLLTKVVGGMANRQIARDLGASPTAIDGQISRLGRHCLLFHRLQVQQLPPPGEIAIDGFETFERSQYHPTEFHLAIEPETSYIRHFTDSELRRKGRMTPYQKRRRAELETLHGRPDPKSVENDVAELLETALAGADEATVRSDLHKAYPRAIRRQGCKIKQETVSSKAHRDRHNLLWEINRLDRMIRHSQAGHARETLAWPKRRQRAAERLAIMVVWWNGMRTRWARRCRSSPAMLSGTVDRVLTVGDVLRRRLFPSHVKLKGRWGAYYRSEVETRAQEINRRHELTYAF